MSRFGRIRRRPDHWPTPHHRARSRAAERLDGPLGLTESQWLDQHLAECSACAAVAAQYDADRSALRVMGETTPEPPRDLWARTAAAIEREAGGSRVSAEAGSRVPVSGRSGRSSRGFAVTALSGVAVAAMVIAVSAVSTGLLDTGGGVAIVDTDGSGPSSAPGSSDPLIASSDAPQTSAPQPTPLLAQAGNVAWVRKDTNGALAVTGARVDQVCPAEGRSGCATLEDDDQETLALTSTPKSVIGSPTDDQAVVISDDGEGGDRIVVLDLPSRFVPPRDTPEPSESATPPPATDPSESPDGSPVGSLPPTPSPEVIPSGSPEPTPTSPASPAPTPSDSAVPTASTEATPSTEPTPPVDPSASVTPEPMLTPEPTVAATLALAEDITLVGESAAFSPDGAWFAFTARPTDGSKGPDVYVWRVGDDAAAPLTDDGMSTFASWTDGSVLISRPSDPSAVAGTQPLTLAVDPANGTETPIEGETWRPVVDPSGDRAVAWRGTIAYDAEARTWQPAEGRLELITWPPADVSGDDGLELIEGPAADVDIRWDETGEWAGVWVADSLDGEVGRLTLFRVDPERGTLDRLEGAPVEEPALAGFSIGQGRVAWVGPSGADGEGSHIHVAAWVGSDVGTAESVPGQGIVIIR